MSPSSGKLLAEGTPVVLRNLARRSALSQSAILATPLELLVVRELDHRCHLGHQAQEKNEEAGVPDRGTAPAPGRGSRIRAYPKVIVPEAIDPHGVPHISVVSHLG